MASPQLTYTQERARQIDEYLYLPAGTPAHRVAYYFLTLLPLFALRLLRYSLDGIDAIKELVRIDGLWHAWHDRMITLDDSFIHLVRQACRDRINQRVERLQWTHWERALIGAVWVGLLAWLLNAAHTVYQCYWYDMEFGFAGYVLFTL